MRESEARYRIVTESASDAILTIDQEHTILFVNPAAERIFGYRMNEMLGQKLFMLIPPSLRDAHAAGMKRYRETGERNISWQGVEVPVRHKDGHEIPVEITFGEIKRNDKSIFTTVIRNISDRKRAEEALRESEQKLRTLVDSMSEGIVKVDLDEKIEFVNDSFCEMTGFTREDLMGSVTYDLLFDDEGRRRVAEANRQRPGGVSSRYEAHLQTKAGEKLWVMICGAPIFSSSGELTGTMAVFTNLTERKHAENRLLQSEANLAAAQRMTHVGSWELDLYDLDNLNNNEVRWSDEVYRIFGFQPREVEVSTELFFKSVHPDDRRHVSKVLSEAIEKREFYIVEHRVLLPNASERIVQGQAEMIFDKDSGRPVKLLGTVQDITERRQSEELVRLSEEKYRSILETIEEGYFETDLEGVFTFFNDALGGILGYGTEDLSGMHYRQYTDHLNAKKLFISYVKVYRTGVPVRDLNWEVICRDGTHRSIESSITLVRTADGMAVGFRGLVRDVTKRKQTEEALRESESKFRLLIESTSEGLLQVDNGDCVQFVNDRFCEMVGYSRDELTRTNWTELLLDDEGRELIRQVNERRRQGVSDSYEMRLKKKSGEGLWVIVGGAPMADARGVLTGSMGVFSDITKRKQAEEQLLHDAFHDGLTGLANRALFMDHLRIAIERGKSRHSNFYAVLFLDFDRFKIVNDSLGHTEGDELLKQIARRLETLTRTGDLVARLGGDEFVVLVSEMLTADDAIYVAERIHEGLKNPFDIAGGEVFISASIGIALSTAGHQSAADMLRDADIAMYRAKAGGRARYQVFNQTMHAHATKRLQLETEMRQALDRMEFELHYQPIIELGSNELTGFEALVRWRHPEHGLIPPNDFIPAAEENGLILPLGRWILRQTCFQLREWHDLCPSASELTMNVNLSVKQFMQPDLVRQVAETLETTGLPARYLNLEITESHLIENSDDVVDIMNRLRDLGVKLSLDDFGTGYSSLSYLHRLPINSLKIDRSFVGRMTESGENSEIVRTIIKLAQNLKMKTVAEGIETAEQLAELNRLSCGNGQGYFFARPLEAQQAADFIREHSPGISHLPGPPAINLDLPM